MCFRIFPVAKKIMDERGKGHQDFLSKKYCLTVRKISVGEPLCDVFQKDSGSEKVYG